MVRTYYPERKISIPNRNIIVINNTEFSDMVVRIKKKHDLVEINPEFQKWKKYIKKQLAFLEKINNL